LFIERQETLENISNKQNSKTNARFSIHGALLHQISNDENPREDFLSDRRGGRFSFGGKFGGIKNR